MVSESGPDDSLKKDIHQASRALMLVTLRVIPWR